MIRQTKYYKIVGRGREEGNPSGIARRVTRESSFDDEALHRDMTWGFTSAISEWERGEELTRDLVQISEEEAEMLIERFREKWGAHD